MAIEIVTPPSRPNAEDRPTYTRTCAECGCKFTYKYSDTVDSAIRGGYVSVPCPHCSYPVAHSVSGGHEDINEPRVEW